MNERTCEIDGCERKHCARGLCKYHYNKTHGTSERGMTPVQCGTCSTSFDARNDELKRGKGKYCSPACYNAAPETREARARARASKRAQWPSSKISIKECQHCDHLFTAHGTGMTLRRYCSDHCAKEAAAAMNGRRNRVCADCGTPLGYYSLVNYCDDCREQRRQEAQRKARRITKHVRRARMRSENAERFDPREIFKRDGWRCGICRRKVNPKLTYPNPKSASLDHIIPLAAGGEHARTNTQCSHLECNINKWHTGPGQLLLIG